MTFYALFVGGAFLLLSGAIVRATGGWTSFFFFKLIPALLGIWLLWEAALIHLTK